MQDKVLRNVMIEGDSQFFFTVILTSGRLPDFNQYQYALLFSKMIIKTGCERLKSQGAMFSRASHGLGCALFTVFKDLFSAWADAQIAALKGKV